MYGYFFVVRAGVGGRRLRPLAIQSRVPAGSITSSIPPPAAAFTAYGPVVGHRGPALELREPRLGILDRQ